MTKDFSPNQNIVQLKHKRAGELIKQARGSTGSRQVELARQALEISPQSVEAYLILGDYEKDEATKVKLYHKAVAAGRLLPKDQLDLFCTALGRLAGSLANLCRYDEAAKYYYQLIVYDLPEGRRARFGLFRVLMTMGSYSQARELLSSYPEPDNSWWRYNDLLLSFCEQGSCALTNSKAKQAMIEAEPLCQLLLEPICLIEAHAELARSPHCSALANAVDYLKDHLDLWLSHPELLTWLRGEYSRYCRQDQKRQVVVEDCANKIQTAVQQGNYLVETGDLGQADQLLTQALNEQEDPMARNVLGYCKLLMHNYNDALAILKPGLGSGYLNPFGYALASECAFCLSDSLGAYRYLQKAIEDFDLGMRSALDLGPFADQWSQYTIIIKAVAGLLGNHRLVIDLHKRWEPNFCSVEDLYQLGVAHFNNQNFSQAQRIWKQITAGEWVFLDKFELACGVFQTQIVTAPDLEYLPPWHLMDDLADEYPPIDELISSAAYKIMVIAELFQHLQEGNNPEDNITILTLSSLGDWGIEFGRAILAAPTVPYCWKVAAMMGLVNQEIYKLGDLIEINHKGRPWTIAVEERFIQRYVAVCLPAYFDYDQIWEQS